MKRNVVNVVSMVLFGAMCVMSACEEFDGTVVEEVTIGSHWERADINLHVNRADFDDQSGTTRSADEDVWENGDRIYLILKDRDGNNVQAYVEYDTATTSWGQVEYDGYKSYLTCTTPRTVEAYYFKGTTNVTSTDITFDATTGVYSCTDGTYTYPANGDLEMTISLVPLTSRIRFTGNSRTGLKILSGVNFYDKFSPTVGLVSIVESSISITTDETGTTPYVYCTFTDSEAPSLVVMNETEGYYFKTIFEASTHVLQVGHSGYMSIPTVNSHRGWKMAMCDSNGHEYVDLGLTSGTLWATMNVGATTVSGYGGYFAWGEVTSRTNSFSWSSYKYSGSSASTLTKYCTDSYYGTYDGKTELELSDDAARYNWGGDWRIPSKAQFEELYNECTWMWTTQNGGYGYLVTSKKNSNSIFLPAAGFRASSLDGTSSYGYYWSRSLNGSSFGGRFANNLYFNSSSINTSYSEYRYYGCSIRPVLELEFD